VVSEGQLTKVRFYGIDAPELKQPGGKESQRYLSRLIVGKDVQTQCRGKSFKRKTCDVFLGTVDVSAQMVGAGMAWDYPEYSHGRYQLQQQAAKITRVGIWAGEPVSPFCWRHPEKSKCLDSQFQP